MVDPEENSPGGNRLFMIITIIIIIIIIIIIVIIISIIIFVIFIIAIIIIIIVTIIFVLLTLYEMCPNTEFFLVRMRKNTDQKKLRIWTLSRSVVLV